MNHIEAFKRVKTTRLSSSLMYPLSGLQRCRYPAGLECDFHNSSYLHVVLIESGSIIFQEESGPKLTCKAGMVIIIPIGCNYRWNATEECIMLMCLHHGFTFKEHGGLALLHGFSQQHLFRIKVGMEYGREFSRQIDLTEKLKFPDVQRSTLIFDLLAKTLEQSGLSPDDNLSDKPDNIAPVLYYIEQNLHHNISLKELAKLAFLSESRFSRIFKEHTGTSPLQYVARRKTAKAVAALKNTNIPAGEIGTELGFDSLNYFSRFIKKHTGKSPSRIRESRNNVIH